MNASSKLCGLLVLLMAIAFNTSAQNKPDEQTKTTPAMKTYLIERDIPGAGNLTPVELKGISQKSCSVLKLMGNGIQWIQSFVTGNKIYCVYKAENEVLLREHAKKGGFPVTNIMEVNNTISPATAEN
jgi:hypothetical protein